MTAENARITVNALVALVAPVIIEWSAEQNKLRIADSVTGKKLAVFSQDAVYGLLAQTTEPGHIVVRNSQALPDILGSLSRQGHITILHHVTDPVTNDDFAVVRVLIAPRSGLI